MEIVRYLLFVSLFPITIQAQFQKAFTLTDSLEEVSGMATDGTYIWMLNDSGNEPLLFEYSGRSFLGAYRIEAENRDWEALTMDLEGNLYLCDIGNNQNDLPKRQIYRIRKQDIDHQFGTITPDTLHISIKEPFPIAKYHRDYDWESAIYYRGALHTFSKNRCDPYDEKVIHFELNSIDSNSCFAKPIDTTNVRGFLKELVWITDACLSKDRRHLFLLTPTKIIGFLDFPTSRFFDGYRVDLPFLHLSQKESIAPWNDTILLIADEIHPTYFGGNMYEYNLSETLKAYEDLRRKEVSISSKELDSTFTITVSPLVDVKVYFQLFDENGELISKGLLGEAKADQSIDFQLKELQLLPGHFILNVISGSIPHGFMVRKTELDPKAYHLNLQER